MSNIVLYYRTFSQDGLKLIFQLARFQNSKHALHACKIRPEFQLIKL